MSKTDIKPDAYYCGVCLSADKPLLSERVNGRCPCCGNAHGADHILGRILLALLAAQVAECYVPVHTREGFLSKWGDLLARGVDKAELAGDLDALVLRLFENACTALERAVKEGDLEIHGNDGNDDSVSLASVTDLLRQGAKSLGKN